MPRPQDYDQRYFAGYEDVWIHQLEEPACPEDIIYMQGWQDAIEEGREVNQ